MSRKSRNTKQKELIQEKINGFKSLFTSEELHLKVQESDLTIGISTIYRYLKDMRKENKIYSYKCNNKLAYSNENNSHCHYVCESCGNIIHFEVSEIDFLKDKVPGMVSSFQIEVNGICDICLK